MSLELRKPDSSSYVRLFLRKASTWHRISRLGYHGDIADLNSAIDTLKLARTLPEHDSSLLKSALESSLSNSFTFADDSEVDITSLEEASSLLLLDELKAIAKEAKVQGRNKGELLQALRRSSGRQTGLGFLKRSETEESAASVEHDDALPQRQDNRDLHYVQKILAETGPCIRLSDAIRKLFERVHLVFYRSTEWTEKSLTTIILARIARWTFPHYLVSRSVSIFASRALLLEFEDSIKLQFRVDSILEFNGPPGKGELEEILDTSDRILPRWRELLAEEQQKEDSIYATGEGAYLRRLSPAWVYTRIIHKGAFVLGKFKHHKREHEILVELLDQKLFHTSRRGDWYQRKALLEEHYLYALNPDQGRTIDAQKKHYKRVALATCEAGIQDRLVHVIYHHDLQKRIVKLEKALKVPKRQQHDFGHVRLAKAIERTFEGVQIIKKDTSRPSTPSENKSTNGALPSFYRSNSNPSTPRRSTKTVWLDPAIPQDDATNEQQTCSVESMCLSQYRALGYKGYHSEGGILKTLFGYLLFDILFLYIPNVFQTEYQTCPLDLHTDAFYPSRLSEINTRLNAISNGEARTILRRVWDDHHEKRTCVVGLDWDYEIEDLEAMCDCFPGAALATLLKVLAQEYGQRGGGIPDLFLWKEMELDMADEGNQMAVLDPSSGKTAKGHVMFSEVKSENDRLSDTQRLWIDIIAGTGVRVEKCNALAKEVRIVG